MKRADLEHVLRAAAALTDERKFVVIGSQAILGARPDAPDILLRAMEADLYSFERPDLSDVIDAGLVAMDVLIIRLAEVDGHGAAVDGAADWLARRANRLIACLALACKRL